MAKKSTAAQHFLECDNCEERPAKFLCKTCPGHLCENCKTSHEKKKMTRSHEIVSLISNNENMVDLLYCKDHTKKKLECYCNRCKEPVCTDCIIQSHNGHSVESLSTVYKRTTDQAREQKEKIDNILLPKYRELVSNETAKESALKRRAEEIKKKIEAHTEGLVEMIKTIGTQTVEDLSKKEKDGLREIEQTKNNFKKQIDELQLMSRKISADIEAKPGISFFKLVERNNLERFEKSQPDIDYSLTNFQPGDIKLGIEDSFGIRPILQRSGHDRFTYREINRKPVRANNNATSRELPAHEQEEWSYVPPEEIEERHRGITKKQEDRSQVRRKGIQRIPRELKPNFWRIREEREELRQKQLQQEWYQKKMKKREELRQKQLQQEGYQGILKEREELRQIQLQQEGLQGLLKDSEWDRKMREEREELRQIQLQQEGLQGLLKEQEELRQKHLQQEGYLGILEEPEEIQLQQKVLLGILDDRKENQRRILKAQEQLLRKLEDRKENQMRILKEREQLRKEEDEKNSKYTIRNQRL